MRAVGMIAMFVLGLAVVVQAGFLIKTSREVDRLARELQAQQNPADDDFDLPDSAPRPVTARTMARPAPVPTPENAPPIPAFVPSAASNSPAVTTLTEALSTPEGREQLKVALEHIREEQRQIKVAENVEKKEKRNEAFRERLKAITLTPDERAKVDNMQTTLQAQRRALFEQMKTSGRPAVEIDDAIDQLEGDARRAMRTLLGDERVKQLREIEKRERQAKKDAERAANPNSSG